MKYEISLNALAGFLEDRAERLENRAAELVCIEQREHDDTPAKLHTLLAVAAGLEVRLD